MGHIDWDRPRAQRGNRTCRFPDCAEAMDAHVQLAVRLRAEKGVQGKMVASKQHGFCRTHAEDVFSRMLAELNRG